jgi:hypothetical protein
MHPDTSGCIARQVWEEIMSVNNTEVIVRAMQKGKFFGTPFF